MRTWDPPMRVAVVAAEGAVEVDAGEDAGEGLKGFNPQPLVLARLPQYYCVNVSLMEDGVESKCVDILNQLLNK